MDGALMLTEEGDLRNLEYDNPRRISTQQIVGVVALNGLLAPDPAGNHLSIAWKNSQTISSISSETKDHLKSVITLHELLVGYEHMHLCDQ